MPQGVLYSPPLRKTEELAGTWLVGYWCAHGQLPIHPAITRTPLSMEKVITYVARQNHRATSGFSF